MTSARRRLSGGNRVYRGRFVQHLFQHTSEEVRAFERQGPADTSGPPRAALSASSLFSVMSRDFAPDPDAVSVLANIYWPGVLTVLGISGAVLVPLLGALLLA